MAFNQMPTFARFLDRLYGHQAPSRHAAFASIFGGRLRDK